MGLGICNLSIVPVRISHSDKSEMITQLVYGDLFTIVVEKDKWTKIKCEFDNYEGWIDSKQYKRLDKSDNMIIDNPTYSSDLVEFIENENKELITISIGSNISNINLLNHKYEGKSISGKQNRDSIVNKSPYTNWVIISDLSESDILTGTILKLHIPKPILNPY